MGKYDLVLTLVTCFTTMGCDAHLKQIDSKWKFGPEFRHDSKNQDNNRWTVQTGLSLKYDNGVGAGLTYRRRDTDNGGGDNDDGVWIDFSFPLWKASDTSKDQSRRILELERRLAQLERATTLDETQRFALSQPEPNQHENLTTR